MNDLKNKILDAKAELERLSVECKDAIYTKVRKRLEEIPALHETPDGKSYCVCCLRVFLGVARPHDNKEEEETDFFCFVACNLRCNQLFLYSTHYLEEEHKAWSDANFRCYVFDQRKRLHLQSTDAYLWLDGILEQIGFYTNDQYESFYAGTDY